MTRAQSSLILAVILAVFCLLTVQGVAKYYPSSDEMQHVDVARGGSLAQMTHFALQETHPPFSYLPLHYWILLSDRPEFGRSLSLVFGLWLIVVYHRLGRRLHGETMGVYAAGLMAFAKGFIIQSYVVRSYTLFLLCISLALYFFLAWRQEGKTRHLAAYAAFTLAGCLTHFAGLFWLATVGAYQTLSMLKGPRAPLIRWLALNGMIALLAGGCCYLWTISSSLKMSISVSHALPARLLAAALYPLLACDYMLPGYAYGLAVVPLWLIMRAKFSSQNATLRMLTHLLLIALVIGMGLAATDRYVLIGGSRQSMWIMPFVVLFMAWLLADLTQALALATAQSIMMAAVLGAGIYAYDPAARFSALNPDEYMLPRKDWLALTERLKNLGPDSVIISIKYDAFELDADHNPYLYMGSPLEWEPLETVMPYYNTRMLFTRSYIDNPPERLVAQEPAKTVLADARTLVFVKLMYSRNPVFRLAVCKDLPKTLLFIPPLAPGREPTMQDVQKSSGVIMTIAKDTFGEVVSPTGAFHHCL